MSFEIRKIQESDREKVATILDMEWGLPIVVKGRILSPDRMPGFIAYNNNDEILGIITYDLDIKQKQCEIVTLNSFKPNIGIGTALIKKVKQTAKEAGCARLWLITTNDNVDALRFYQMRGFRFVTVHRGAIAQSRKIKPSIPDIGCYGIPIHDEIELELDI